MFSLKTVVLLNTLFVCLSIFTQNEVYKHKSNPNWLQETRKHCKITDSGEKLHIPIIFWSQEHLFVNRLPST